VRRALVLAVVLLPGLAQADAYHDLGKPDQCGAYPQASYDRKTWFPGGEGGQISLADPQSVAGVNAVVYTGTITEEGFSDPAGRVLALRGPLLTADGPTEDEILVIMTESGVRLLKKCP
jgi:hypothetical protein